MPDYLDVEPSFVEATRRICLAFPDAREEPAWAGLRYVVRRRTFAHLLAISDPAGADVTVLAFSLPDDERDVVLASGDPFFRPGSGAARVGMVVDDATDWTEVAELLTESYCLMAPQKLADLVDRPPV